MDVTMTLLTLFSFFAVVHSGEIHSLHYIYTAFSKDVSQPGMYKFTAMGILNDRPIDTYNSKDKVKKPAQEWMGTYNDKEYWQKGTHSRRSKQQWFDVNVEILIKRMRHNESDNHILQWMHGCEAERTTEGKMKFIRGYDQYGYDGTDFLSFDSGNDAWVAPVTQAEPTKVKWDAVPVLSQYTKGYLTTDCVQWLEKFVRFQEQALKGLKKPEVHIFSKRSTQPDFRTLVCLATGFYPKDIAVNILKDGVILDEVDGVASSGVRPNGDEVETYQLRKTLEIKASDTSKYSCKVEHSTLEEAMHKYWDGECCNCDTNPTGAIVGAIVVLIIVAALVGGGLFLYKKKFQATGPQVPREQPRNGVEGNGPHVPEEQPLNRVTVIAPQDPEMQPLNGEKLTDSKESVKTSSDSGVSEQTMDNGEQAENGAAA